MRLDRSWGGLEENCRYGETYEDWDEVEHLDILQAVHIHILIFVYSSSLLILGLLFEDMQGRWQRLVP
jgi:hypothetical protein